MPILGGPFIKYLEELRLKGGRFTFFIHIVFLLLATNICIFSQEMITEVITEPLPSYSLGDQTLSINGGLFVPLFFQSLDLRVHGTNLTPGAAGSIIWKTYINNNFTLGMEIGGMFAFSRLNFPNLLLMLPLTIQGAYIMSMYPFEFPLYLGIGIDVVRYLELTHFDLILKPGFSAFWVYDSSWSFGLNCVYWWIFQPILDTNYQNQTRAGNFLEISLSALYHF